MDLLIEPSGLFYAFSTGVETCGEPLKHHWQKEASHMWSLLLPFHQLKDRVVRRFCDKRL